MQTTPQCEEMQRAFLGGDASYDGVFFTGVRTTGIFCKPSCSARKPLPSNVEFFPTAREALFAGYRPCKRCHPMQSAAEAPEWVHQLMKAVEHEPERRFQDADLRAMGVEPSRARRYFLDRFGMTFHAYSRARRLAAAFTQIREGGKLDDAVFDSGYESHSGFREAFARVFGQAPGSSRDKDCVVTAWVETPVGPMIAGATPAGVCLFEFTDRRMLEKQLTTVRKRFGCAVIPGESAHLEHLKADLQAYFDKESTEFTVPLDVRGTPFQEQVWAQLRQIPCGQTWSYEELARRVGNPAAVRAVARANGMNRIAILIPCHRVVNKDGQLGGYGGGLWRKAMLLELEGAPGFTRPACAQPALPFPAPAHN
jgi:AraC family transcriptional regulator, regulatory protein of adaptative response / methylated-DNA-[protein]-cysteine methyltransferase